MKRFMLISLLISCVGNAQFFESENSNPEHEQTQSGAFDQDKAINEEPDQGLDGPGNPGEPVPVDGWVYVLPLLGLSLGVYFINRKRKWA